MADSDICDMLEELSKNIEMLTNVLEKCGDSIVRIKNVHGTVSDAKLPLCSTVTEYDDIFTTIENDIQTGKLDLRKTSIGNLIITLIQNDTKIAK